MAAGLLVMTLGLAVLNGCAMFGTNPKGSDLQRIELSSQYNAQQERFDNPDPGVIQTVEEVSMNWGDVWKWLVVKGERTPDEPMPQITPDMGAFAVASGGVKAIWFGHSSVLIRMAEQNILLDPVFSDRASPVPFTVGRFQEPVVDLKDLPEIDLIVISHDHYDHLDMDTVKAFRDRATRFIVPLGVGSHLKGWGIDESRITELDWWQSTQRGELEFVATPASHFSGRGMTNRNKTLWASWVIRSENESVYFSGDSGYGSHFKQIGDAYGPFDVAFIENGQYNIKWHSVHLLPDEAAQAYFDLRAEMFIPIHWAMFELSMHTWYQPGMEIYALAEQRGINLVTPMIGEMVDTDKPLPRMAWWRPWINPEVAEQVLAKQ
ncbi:hydrolase [Pseudodesulfovibrio sp. zrk46]|nr:hydrolase [Pseudodesulfovibrio sp. zrk46]